MTWLFSKALMQDYENSRCSQEQVEESSEATYSDGEPYAQLNVMPTPHKFWRNDKTIDASDLSRFGLTLRLLTDDHGEAVLMSYLAAFPARILAAPAKAQELKESEADYGGTWNGSFAKWSQDSSSWRTRQCSLLGGLEPFSETWPQWGSMRNGECFQQQAKAQIMSETGFGYMPTPTTGCTMVKSLANRWDSTGGSGARKALLKLGMSKQDMTQQRNPEYLEWQMMWPLGWTEVKPLAMDKFREWQQQHGGFLANETK